MNESVSDYVYTYTCMTTNVCSLLHIAFWVVMSYGMQVTVPAHKHILHGYCIQQFSQFLDLITQCTMEMHGWIDEVTCCMMPYLVYLVQINVVHDRDGWLVVCGSVVHWCCLTDYGVSSHASRQDKLLALSDVDIDIESIKDLKIFFHKTFPLGVFPQLGIY